uniref:Brix domain-containing protein n=1 Tax=Oryza punctata TaxID=4537 RepID=A0A0E0L5L2_ORYPU
MAKGGDGATAKKAKRKRRSDSKSEDLEREEPNEKKQNGESVPQINYRHKGQLSFLAALVTSKKTDLQATDARDEILRGYTSTAGLYMEWSKEHESYFLYASSQSKSATIKFELLAVAGLEAFPQNIEVKKPLLVFSEGFANGGEWEDTQMLLFELFSKSVADVSCSEDYLYAFTRCWGKIYFRIYKINSLAGPDKEGSMNEKFSVRHNVNYFLYSERFLMYEGINSMSVLSCSSSSGKASLGTIKHLQCLSQYSLMLPTPPDLSEWEGFNTNIAEYFDLYHALKRTKIPGTGPPRFLQSSMIFPEEYYWHLRLPSKVFARSLIICVGSTFKNKACYMDIKEENIFIR